MPITNLKGVGSTTVTDAIGVVSAGKQSISFANTGDVDGTLTQNGVTWPLPAGSVFNLPILHSPDCWHAVTIDATGTVIVATYY